MFAQAAQMIAEPHMGQRNVRRIALVIALIGVAWTLLVIALGMGVYALYLVAVTFFVPPAAAAVTAMAVAGAAVLALRMRKQAAPPENEKALALQLVERYPLPAAAAALAAGVMVAASPDVRAVITRELLQMLTKST